MNKVYQDYQAGVESIFKMLAQRVDDKQMQLVRNAYELMEKAEDPEDYYIHVIMQEKIKLYLEYVDNSSFWYDIKLIFQTFKVIVTER